jgi:hypothetical protein
MAAADGGARAGHEASEVTGIRDKVNWRMLNNRRPGLEWTCGKLAMKEYARAAGLEGLRVPRTCWSGSDVLSLGEADLPQRWVLKPNYRPGLVYFGSDETDLHDLAMITRTWLDTFEAPATHEWAHAKVRTLFLVEELLGPPGSPPPDYKIFVFNGKADLIEMVNRYDGDRQRLYRPDWTPLEVLDGPRSRVPVAPRPPGLDRLLDIAEQLGQPFDFIRVDLYDVRGSIVFGELTPYPCGGLERLRPASFDAELGERWQLPAL